jgi:AMMECR1 domain-containing protein
MSKLERADQQRLLRIAREAIEAAVCPDAHLRLDPSSLPTALLEPAAAFVTLHEHGELRGCKRPRRGGGGRAR